MRDVARRRRSATRRRLVAAGVTIAVLGGGGTAIALQPAAARYRTATATTDDVTQQVSVSATVASASRVDTAFGASGTVATVEVAAGDRVEAGAVLATLDADELQDAVDEAEELLAEAQQTLADDLEAQASGTSSTSNETDVVNASSAVSGATSVSKAVHVVTASSTSAVEEASSSKGGTVLVVNAMSTSTGTSASTVAPSAASDDAAQQAVADARAALQAAQERVQAAQQALLAGYESVEEALLAGSSALGTSHDAVAEATGEQSPCAVFLGAGASGDDGSGDPDGSEGDGSTSDGDLAACVAAIVAAQEALVTTDEAQQVTGAAQTTLTDLVADLDDAVTTLGETAEALNLAVQALPEDGTPTPAPTPEPTQTAAPAPTSGSGASGGSRTPPDTAPGGTAPSGATASRGDTAAGGITGGAGATAPSGGSSPVPGGAGAGEPEEPEEPGTITAERILADRAAVTLAERQLDIATAAAAAGTLTAPIAGTVGQVDVTTGASVGPNDTAVTILGDDGYLLSTTLDLSEVRLVEVGQAVTATVPATGGQYAGTVSSVGLLADAETFTPSYAAAIALDTNGDELPEGASASAAIDVAAADDVLVVPTSAVTTDGPTRTVRVLDGDEVRTVEVTTGAVGPEHTEVTDGLAVGDEVVLADLEQSLVPDDEEESSGLTGLGGSDIEPAQGRFPGGGRPQGFTPPAGGRPAG